MTKRKIGTRIKEHYSDLQHNRGGTALAQLHRSSDITVDFKSVKKLAPFINHRNSFFRESAEIIRNPNSINLTEHSNLDTRWRKLLCRRHPVQDKVCEQNSYITTKAVDPFIPSADVLASRTKHVAA